MLAGLSVDYVIRLEHGRAMRPSAQVVGALARALQLSRSERDLLFTSAGLLPPRDSLVSAHVPDSVQRLVNRLADIPIGVFAVDWTLLMWNRPWTALHGDAAVLPVAERNLARMIFGDGPGARALRPSFSDDAGRFERSIVADLRAAVARHPHDQSLRAMIDELAGASAHFAQLWADTSPAEHVSQRKTIAHPRVGEITLDCDVLDVPGAGLHIITFTAAAGSEDQGKLDLIRAVSV